MRRTVVRKGLKLGQALPVREADRQRNINADVVGKNKARQEALAKRRKKN